MTKIFYETQDRNSSLINVQETVQQIHNALTELNFKENPLLFLTYEDGKDFVLNMSLISRFDYR